MHRPSADEGLGTGTTFAVLPAQYLMRPGIESKPLFPSTDGKRMSRTVAMHVVGVERIAGTISQLSCTEQ